MPGQIHTMALDTPYVIKADELPPELSKRIDDGKCIVFLGAGASLGARDRRGENLPAWWQMVEELLKRLNEVDPSDRDMIDEMTDLMEHGELLALSECLDHTLPKDVFAEYLRNRLSNAQGSEVHKILSTKAFAGVMTTNYDNLAEKYWGDAGWRPFVVTPHLDQGDVTHALAALDDASNGPMRELIPIIKPHGTWERPDSIVFGPRAYRKIIFDNEPFRKFMLRVLSEYIFLFVGLSFKDPNLQSLLQWVRTVTAGRTPIHYATLENRGRIFKRYFREHFGIKLLTYPVGTPRDHSACLPLLKSFPDCVGKSHDAIWSKKFRTLEG